MSETRARFEELLALYPKGYWAYIILALGDSKCAAEVEVNFKKRVGWNVGMCSPSKQITQYLFNAWVKLVQEQDPNHECLKGVVVEKAPSVLD